MPRDPFITALDRRTPGLDDVREIADEFEISLTSTAIRFAKLSSEPVAAVVSQNRAVRYCWVSKALGNVPGIGRIPMRPGDPVPSSATLWLNSNPQKVQRAHRVAVNCRSDSGFPRDSTTTPTLMHHDFLSGPLRALGPCSSLTVTRGDCGPFSHNRPMRFRPPVSRSERLRSPYSGIRTVPLLLGWYRTLAAMPRPCGTWGKARIALRMAATVR